MRIYSVKDLDSLHPCTKYAAEAVLGLRVVCRREMQACERHLNDLDRQGTPAFPYVFDETRADRIYKWFENCCRHVRGPFTGQPIELEPFQKFDKGCVFGWVHMDTGKRRFRKTFEERARGNVKSTEMSGIALYGMCGDCVYPPFTPGKNIYEGSPEVECAAVDREQAKRVWLDARAMAEASPDISERLNTNKTFVNHKTRGGWLKPLSKDSSNKDSGAPCLVIIDEYHKWSTSEIHDTLYNSFGKRNQPLMCVITTAGEDAENSPAKKEYDICCKILDREIIREDYFIMIRELDQDDDPHDADKWVKANPILQANNEYSEALLEQIHSEHDLAYDSGDPSKIRAFLIKRCDCWVTDSEHKYMSGLMDAWKALAVSRDKFAELTLGARGWRGLDLSKMIDLTADAFVCWLPDGRLAVSAHGYIPSDGVTRHEHSDRVPYRDWARGGWCTITPGAVTDYSFIKKHIRATEEDNRWSSEQICYDPYNATHFMQDMESEGYVGVEVRQGVRTLSEPTKMFRELVMQGQIAHDGNPLLTWCLSNAYETTDSNGNIKLSKKDKDDSQRIDLLAAVINAMTQAIGSRQMDLNSIILSEGWSL